MTLAQFQQSWPTSRYTLYLGIAALILATCSQMECEAKRVLQIETGYAVEDAAKRQGKPLEYGIYGPGKVK